jgi:hypothetical protein
MRIDFSRMMAVVMLMLLGGVAESRGWAQAQVWIAPEYTRPEIALKGGQNKATGTADQMQSFFSTHVHTIAGNGYYWLGPSHIGNLFVCPFMTPPAGVDFNSICVNVGKSASFGVYNQQGGLVLVVDQVETAGLQVVNLSGRLPGGKLFYTAWGYTVSDCDIEPVYAGTLPNCGVIRNGLINGWLPTSVDLNSINRKDRCYPIAITFMQYDPKPVPQEIDVLEPAGGEIFMAGDSMPIHWRGNLNTAGSGVKLELTRNGNWVADLGNDWNPSGEGTKTVVVPQLETGSDYRVRVISTWNPLLRADSGPFTISGKAVLVISPNGGESWPTGSQQQIRWKTNSGIAGTAIRLELWLRGLKVMDLGQASNATGEGLQNIQVPTVSQGTGYRVRVVSLAPGAPDDESDEDFSLTPPNDKSTTDEQAWPIYQ